MLFEYQPQNEDELELKAGDIVDITEEVLLLHRFYDLSGLHQIDSYRLALSERRFVWCTDDGVCHVLGSKSLLLTFWCYGETM